MLFVLLLVGAGIFYYAHRHASSYRPLLTRNPNAEPHFAVPSHPATSEGQTIQVPNNVPQGAVQNYQLITENDEFKIRKLQDTYTITIYAIINNPSQSAAYHQQLHDYKQAALTYLTQHGVDVNKVSIAYDPPEAANY